MVQLGQIYLMALIFSHLRRKFTRVKTVFRRSYIIPFGRSNIDGEELVCRVIVKSKRHQQFMVQNRLQMLNTFAAAEQQ
jgi:hypothetical protein